MALAIITAEQRIRSAPVKAQIWGPAGRGKTTLLKTLDNPTTLAICPEDGMLSVQKDDEFGPRFTGDSIIPENWPEHQQILAAFKANPRPFALQKYRTIFIDSTSIISKQCFDWAKDQPAAFNKQGQPNKLGQYGLLGEEMCTWAWGWKSIPDLNVFMIGGLEMKETENNGKQWQPLVMGSKLANELPYIFDYSLVMDHLKADDGKTYTVLYTSSITHPQYASVPLKTRGGGLAPIEQPHLGRLMAKALGFAPNSAPPPSTVANEPGSDATSPSTYES